MDLDRLKQIVDWMAKTPLVEMQISDGDFEVHLKKGTGAAPPAATEPPLSSGHEIAAPGYGIIHLSPAPGSAPFVTQGQKVAIGQTLCVIEAMKVFSPIEADRAGTIAEILVADGTEASAGQALFRLE